jgi:flavin reductase (DIM6/NTAB) family NADH-FMN oxidoreductase RutF
VTHCTSAPLHADQDASAAFDALVGALDAPMYVVTAADGDERDGCLVGFASQCSIHPSRFMVWLSSQNRTYRIAQRASTLGVHRLRHDQLELAEHFGGETADEVDKLASVDWRPGPGGVPVLDGCDWFAGRVVQRVDVGGDHLGFALDPVDGEVLRPDAPALGLRRARRIDPGHPA